MLALRLLLDSRRSITSRKAKPRDRGSIASDILTAESAGWVTECSDRVGLLCKQCEAVNGRRGLRGEVIDPSYGKALPSKRNVSFFQGSLFWWPLGGRSPSTQTN